MWTGVENGPTVGVEIYMMEAIVYFLKAKAKDEVFTQQAGRIL